MCVPVCASFAFNFYLHFHLACVPPCLCLCLHLHLHLCDIVKHLKSVGGRILIFIYWTNFASSDGQTVPPLFGHKQRSPPESGSACRLLDCLGQLIGRRWRFLFGAGRAACAGTIASPPAVNTCQPSGPAKKAARRKAAARPSLAASQTAFARQSSL